jgi:Holliday junction DNA helicase RuvA
VGYEILLPAFVMETIRAKSPGDTLPLYIYYQQTERLPKPMLIGFNSEVEKEFFHHIISVEDIGPLKAVKALSLPVREIARAIESRDVVRLKQLKGIGNRTAQKIIATLEGKMDKFALMRPSERPGAPNVGDISKQVEKVLVEQLGYRIAESRKMIGEAMKRKPDVTTPEQLLEEVYRGEKHA